MKTHQFRSLGALLLALCFGSIATADPVINGSVGFAGEFSTNNNADFTLANTFTAITAYVLTATGDYASIPVFSPAAFSTFAFNASNITPLWSISGGTYSFNATLTDIATTASSIIASGFGTASITGFAPTSGTWNLAGTGTGLSLTFASGTTVPGGASNGVPDGASTLVLLGAGLLGVSAFQLSRRLSWL